MSLTERAIEFRQTPSVTTLYSFVADIVEQRRLLEVLHSAALGVVHGPGPTRRSEVPAHVQHRAELVAALGETGVTKEWRTRHPLIGRWISGVTIRPHGAAECGDVTVVGEYAERTPRLYLLTQDTCRISEYYTTLPGVRHIHCVHPLDHEHFFVSTGDSSRLLDIWEITGGEFHLQRRVQRLMGGFTAAATVGPDVYLGSDFSSRPNYILRFRDRRKFFLPSEAFKQYVYMMECLDDRYLLVASKALNIAGGASSVTIFDSQVGCFIQGTQAA